ncbi:hypothetical protein, partial [Pseudonocardia sp. ICBG601]|uniref:hypothetical protein n=1 Tax=Pseudonocardia sp. ICBG601 TaxID=2846759 RepID=UPI0027E2EA91
MYSVAPAKAWLENANTPERDEAEVCHRGVGDEPTHVGLGDRQQRGVDDPATASTSTSGARTWLAC